MKTLHVSCLYDLYKIPPGPDPELYNLSLDFRKQHYRWLIDCDIDLIMFVEPELVSDLPAVKSNVRIVPLSLDTLKIYNRITQAGDLQLPDVRKPAKDTQKYMALINSKLEMMNLARSMMSAEYYTWIDSGISKIFHDKDAAKIRVEQQALVENTTKIVSPAGWPQHNTNGDFLEVNSPDWCMLGGYLVVPDNLMLDFYQQFTHNLETCINNNRIVWEVNLWSQCQRQKPDNFHLFYNNGQHDDTMIQRPDLSI